MCAKPDQPEARDQAMDRLLAATLKTRAALDAPVSGGCPDAELVAAYADQGLAGGPGNGLLSSDERARLENHFASCQRCQQIFAALGASLEAPAAAPVAVMPAPVAPQEARLPAASSQRWLWWLSPAFGAAAAALLWMVLRPAAPQPVQTAADYSRAAEPETRALNAPAAPRASEPPESAARGEAKALDRLSKVEPAAKEAEADAREKAVARLAAPSADSAPAAAPPVPAARSEIAAVIQPQAAAAQAMTAPAAALPVRDQGAAASAQAQPQARAAAALGAIAPQQATAEPQLNAGGQASLYTFSPPEGGVTWRLGIAGLIERSTDEGRTWQPQSSGVTSDLVAGSAANKQAAWVVGRGGVILRTADGEHWERVTGPAGVTSEWAAVAAHDAMSASVAAQDLRRFSTEDGGRTWVQQP